jgi:hypothetical protein
LLLTGFGQYQYLNTSYRKVPSLGNSERGAENTVTWPATLKTCFVTNAEDDITGCSDGSGKKDRGLVKDILPAHWNDIWAKCQGPKGPTLSRRGKRNRSQREDGKGTKLVQKKRMLCGAAMHKEAWGRLEMTGWQSTHALEVTAEQQTQSKMQRRRGKRVQEQCGLPSSQVRDHWGYLDTERAEALGHLSNIMAIF